jgi:NAD(P)-dependent dehydrogenase (short-subunit alcohol dehydrogenase family)
MKLPLGGRVAVVIGATGGIGAPVCRRLAGAGASIVAGYRRDASAATALASSLVSLEGNRHSPFQVDVTNPEALQRFAYEIDSRYGRVDVLVNSAGTTRFVPHDDLDSLNDQLIDEIFRTNWRGPFATIRALKPLLVKTGDALVVNISSIAGITGVGSNVAYCASKAALNAMTLSLARALAPAVRVVSVSPGVVETQFIKALDQSWLKEQERRTPLGRLASPEEVADAVLAVATSLRYSTGCIIPVDGGRPLS